MRLNFRIQKALLTPELQQGGRAAALPKRNQMVHHFCDSNGSCGSSARKRHYPPYDCPVSDILLDMG